jgi:hypothetical protein
MTTVDLEMMVVSSSYSVEGDMLLDREILVQGKRAITFTAIAVIDEEVEVASIAQATLEDDFTLQFKDGDACAIKVYSCRFSLRLELEED